MTKEDIDTLFEWIVTEAEDIAENYQKNLKENGKRTDFDEGMAQTYTEY